MKLSEYLDSPENWADPSLVESLYHEDYMYLRETEMLSRDEFILHMKEDFVGGKFKSTNLKVLYEDDKVVSFEHDVESPLGLRRVTLTSLKKEGKLWRQMMSYEEL
jgi:hypothetical protein